jgi:hypothetical protein
MTNNFIEKEWQQFRKMAISRNASSIQINEMRRAFYAGIKMLFNVQRTIALNDKINEEDAVNILTNIQTECRRFILEMTRIYSSGTSHGGHHPSRPGSLCSRRSLSNCAISRTA